MEKLNTMMEVVLSNLQQSINYAEENNLTNTQEFINFLDTVNELSVSH
jgi:hypothetical protein